MYLVIGANGYLGSYMLKAIMETTEENIIATARSIENVSTRDRRIQWKELDVENFNNVESFSDIITNISEPVKVIYLAAYHHPDMVEKNPQKAWNVNITSLSFFLNCMPKFDYFVYPSTDTVYGEGSLDKPFKEDSPLRPVNRYGKQKVLAEALVTGYGYNVVRYPFLIAPSLLKHKKHFYDVILETISAGKKMEMFSDSYRSSLDFATVAKLTVKLAERKGNTPPVLNVSGDKPLSKYDVGLMIAKKHGINTDLIVPISAAEKNEYFEVPRAAATILDNSKIKEVLDISEIEINI